MKTHTLNLNPIYFDLIKSRIKTLEGRLNDEKRRNFNIGDRITFFKEPERNESMDAIIIDKYLFSNFSDMVNTLNKESLGFANATNEDIINTYRQFYTIEDETKYGVVIFKIKVI